MYITLKGIGKIQFVSMLRILLICKFLNFTAAFTKKWNFPKFAFNFPCEKVNFSLIHRTHINIHSRALLSSKVLPVVSESYIQINSYNSDYWIFLISRSSPIHMSCSRIAIGTRAQSFNLWLISEILTTFLIDKWSFSMDD